MKALTSAITAFLETKSHLSTKTLRQYDEGFAALETYIEQYSEGSYPRGAKPRDIHVEDLDHILGYFVIRKFLMGTPFRMSTAKTLRAFFLYLADNGEYDKDMAQAVRQMTLYYNHEYPRIGELEHVLWNVTEGKIDEVMQLPPTRQQAAIQKLREQITGAEQRELGYVTITNIKGDTVQGMLMGVDNEIEPVYVGKDAAELIRVGDIINMITVVKPRDSSVWEIVELGYVYPRSYFGGERRERTD